MPTFQPNRSLLNAKFEGYKLDAIDQDAVLSRFRLEHALNQSSATGKSPLSFQEVQSRIRHNHLTVGPNATAVYIDSASRVIRISWNETESHPIFEVVYELPQVLQSADTDGPHREYPSAAFLDESRLFVSDGNGTLYAMQVGETGPATLLNSFELKTPEEHKIAVPIVPFRVHLAKHQSENSCVLLLSSKYYAAPSDDPPEKKLKKLPSKYDVWAVSIDLNQVSQDQPLSPDIKWHRRGEDVPSYVSYLESRSVFMLLGSSPYRPLSVPQPTKYEPAPDELAPIPRANELLDNASTLPQSTSAPKPPPYSWTQTTDSVTVAFALPSDTPKNAIKVTFSGTTLTILVIPESTEISSPPAVPLPRYTLKKFWDNIHPSTSFWTFDRQAEHACGILTLHLDKQHEGTRWSHLFATSDDAEEVPEILDPSELYAIRESLEKYTAELQTGGAGLGHGVPSLAEGEMDDEVDLDMGDAVVVTWVGADGSVPSWAGSDSPFSILATPIPTFGEEAPSVVVKNGLDGLVYSLDVTENEEIAWTHTSTFCVLSFVLASKRDTRFVHHVSSRSVLAFESGARGLGSNVYIYRGTARPGDKHAKQAVLKVGNVSSGPLLGVGMIKTRGGETVTLCLCERELAMIRNTV